MARPDETPAAQGAPDFASRLSDAIAHHHLTLERVSSHLRTAGTPVSIATLSYWQSGRSLPTRTRSLAAVDELERLLRLPVGHLSSALPSSHPAPTGDGHGDRDALPPGEQALLDLGIDPVHHHRTHWVQDHVTTSAGGTQQTERTRQLLEAERDGLDRIPLVFRQTDERGPVHVETGAGCTLGRTVDLAEHAMLAAELLLPHPLRRGDLWMVEYRVTWDITDVDGHGFARVHTKPVGHHILQATFEVDPPTWASYFTTPAHAPGQAAVTRHQPVPAGPVVQIALTDPTPGTHGLSWGHDEQEPA